MTIQAKIEDEETNRKIEEYGKDIDGKTIAKEDSTLFQLSEWVKGNPIHNKEKDICCPDFSCCIPELLADEETRKRFSEAFLADDEKTYMAFLFMFLNKMLDFKKINAFVIGDDTLNQKMN